MIYYRSSRFNRVKVIRYRTTDPAWPSDCDWMIPNLRDPYGQAATL